ncbi:MAG: hypothetical protein E7663_02785 [Ruminococcaceae bacterium]|nr:hypothetical protein [Oscillospiraceae bacterium]
MGLFGYNAKDYAKNTEIMKQKIQDLWQRAMQYPGVGTALNTAMIKMQEFPKGADGKQLEQIDARIFKLIDQMMTDVQQESAGKLSAHANMLMAAVTKSRNYGKEAYPPEQLKAQEMMAECNANIEENLTQKEKIAKEMEAIINRAKKIQAENPNSAELQRLQLKYAQFNKEKDRIEQNLQLWVKQYNNTVRQLKVMEDGSVYDEISATNLQTPAQFAHMVEQVSVKLNKIVEDQTAIDDIASGYEEEKSAGVRSTASADDGGFWAAMNNSSDVSSDIFGSTATAKDSGETGGDQSSSNPFGW